MTATLNPTTLDFRSATLTSGTVTTASIETAISLVVPSGATLGTVNATQSRIVVLAINNSATELAVVNLSGGNNLDETTLISTTALSAAADSANVIYSTTARTNVPFRVVGYIESTQATAGTWVTAPSTIQGMGGQSTGNLTVRNSLNVNGLAPMYACRAWVNFNGTGTVAIRASGNVSSITDGGVGVYTVNLTTAISDANGAALASGNVDVSTPNAQVSKAAMASSSAVNVICAAGTNSAIDYAYVSVLVFR